MHFQISEDEFNRLTAITGHIGLMLDLACHIVGRGEVAISAENLRCFLSASHDGLSGVLQTLLDRHDHDAQCERREASAAPRKAGNAGVKTAVRKRERLTSGAA